MIKGFCKSNVDDFRKGTWPEIFVAVPRPGEIVANSNGFTMKVVGVTHRVRNKPEARDRGMIEFEPYIEVELWKQPIK